MFYKNISNSVKTFYGVTFKPGETHEVPGFINASTMLRQSKPAEPPKPQKKSPDKTISKTSSEIPTDEVIITKEENSNGTDNNQ